MCVYMYAIVVAGRWSIRYGERGDGAWSGLIRVMCMYVYIYIYIVIVTVTVIVIVTVAVFVVVDCGYDIASIFYV